MDAAGNHIAIIRPGKKSFEYFIFGNMRFTALRSTPAEAPRLLPVTVSTTGIAASGDPFEAPYAQRPAGSPDTLVFYQFDHLGNTRLAYRSLGGTRQVLHTADYYPFGKPLRTWSYSASQTLRYQSTGHQRDRESGLDYRLARFYDSDVGRFLSVDPLAGEAQQWTPYRAFYDNPINYTDPTGLFEDWVQNDETGEILWDDDVTSKETTPEGFTYIGESNQDIVTHLFGQSSFSTSTWDIGAIGFDDFDNPYSSKGAAFYNISVKTDMNLTLYADVNYDLKTGRREFKGINMFVSIIGDVSMDNHPLVDGMNLGKGADMLANGTQLSFWNPEPNRSYFLPGGDVTAFYSGFISSSSLQNSHRSSRQLNLSYTGLYSTSSSYLSDVGISGAVFKRPNKTHLNLSIDF